MKRILTAILAFVTAATLAFAVTPQTITQSFSNSYPDPNFGDFTNDWNGMSDLVLNNTFTNGYSQIGLRLANTQSKGGKVYMIVTNAATTNMSDYTLWTSHISHSNFPPASTYWAEYLAYDNNGASVLAAGQINIHWSIWSDTNYPGWTNVPGVILFPFATTGMLQSVYDPLGVARPVVFNNDPALTNARAPTAYWQNIITNNTGNVAYVQSEVANLQSQVTTNTSSISNKMNAFTSPGSMIFSDGATNKAEFGLGLSGQFLISTGPTNKPTWTIPTFGATITNLMLSGFTNRTDTYDGWIPVGNGSTLVATSPAAVLYAIGGQASNTNLDQLSTNFTAFIVGHDWVGAGLNAGLLQGLTAAEIVTQAETQAANEPLWMAASNTVAYTGATNNFSVAQYFHNPVVIEGIPLQAYGAHLVSTNALQAPGMRITSTLANVGDAFLLSFSGLNGDMTFRAASEFAPAAVSTQVWFAFQYPLALTNRSGGVMFRGPFIVSNGTMRVSGDTSDQTGQGLIYFGDDNTVYAQREGNHLRFGDNSPNAPLVLYPQETRILGFTFWPTWADFNGLAISNMPPAVNPGDPVTIDQLPPLTSIDTNPVARALTATSTQQWNSAYSWGDHHLAGYLTGSTDVFSQITVADKTMLGANLTSNGTFTGSATGWALEGVWYYQNGLFLPPDGEGRISPTNGLAIQTGHVYYVTFDVTCYSDTTFSLTLGGISKNFSNVNGVQTLSTVICAQDSSTPYLGVFTYATEAYVDNFFIYEVTGGDLTAAHNVNAVNAFMLNGRDLTNVVAEQSQAYANIQITGLGSAATSSVTAFVPATWTNTINQEGATQVLNTAAIAALQLAYAYPAITNTISTTNLFTMSSAYNYQYFILQTNATIAAPTNKPASAGMSIRAAISNSAYNVTWWTNVVVTTNATLYGGTTTTVDFLDAEAWEGTWKLSTRQGQ